MASMIDDISHEAGQTLVTDFFQFALDEVVHRQSEDMNPQDCNHIRIDTFKTKSGEPLTLHADSKAPRSVIRKKQMKRIIGKVDR